MNLIIKGFLIGVAKIIPGVSGAMLAISFGIYYRTIEIISDLKSINEEKIKFLTKIGIGIILAITLSSKIIVKCLKQHYLATMLLFIGMIVGTIPNMMKKTRINRNNIKDIIIASIIILILITIIKKIQPKAQVVIEYNTINYIKLIGIGMIDASSSIIPGISGTALLMMLGYYDIIIKAFSTTWNIYQLRYNIFILSSFIIGFIIGIIVLSKIISIVINKNKNVANITILIFIIITIFQLLKKTFMTNNSIYELIIGTILLILGMVISSKLDIT